MMQGNCVESGKEIKQALSELRNIFQLERDYTEMEFDDEVKLQNEERFPLSPMTSVKIPINASSSIAQVGAFNLFNRALIVNSGPIPENRISSVLLYNAGLSHHINAVRSGSSTELASALQFYRYAFSLLACSNEVRDENLLMLLALINNMGHIYANTFDSKASNHCMEMMQRFFAASEGGDSLGECDSLFFYMNTFLVKMDQFSAAPAA